MTMSWDFNHRYSLFYKSVGNVDIFFGSHVIYGWDKNNHADRERFGW